MKALSSLLLSILIFSQNVGAAPVDSEFPDPPLSSPSSESMGGDAASDDNYRLNYHSPFELNKRGGLGNFFSKIRSGNEITVAYLGGSITMESGGWADRTQGWMEKHYPLCKFHMIKSAINGTGADLAACRIGHDVLPYHPDLLFVEFVVNGGGGSDPDGIVRALEGIVRQTWQVNPSTDICFVYTVAAPQLKDYPDGGQPVFSESAQAHEKVADFYSIPSIALGCQVSDLLHSGDLVFQARQNSQTPGKIVFSHDGIHPTNEGSQLYAGALVRSFLAMEASPANPPHHGLEQTLDPLNWQDATEVGVGDLHDKLVLSGTWDWLSRDDKSSSYGVGFPYEGSNLPTIKTLFPQLLGTSCPGSEISFKFQGTKLGFFDVGGPFAGQLAISVDHGKIQKVNRFTSYSSHIRHQYFFLPRLSEGVHEVHLILDPDIPNKSAMADFKQNQAIYQKTEFYLGKLLMIGKILPL